MNPELPDLNFPSAAYEITSRTAGHFTTILWGLAVVAPWLLFVTSVMSGTLLWLTAFELIGTHVGLLVVLRGYRDGNQDLKRWGAGIHATTLLLCLAVAAISQ
ncbi:hypothetical protein [Streptomyces viridochromogenes]|uniref:hypothetical protein n=1 Tax=Streptomyces viridochromogenes TaxID=1938 RepID=UPI001319BDFB|nr:hypothetical protein [Streptomyces viridochromogenes]